MTRPVLVVVWSGILLGSVVLLLATARQDAGAEESAFSNTTINLGVVVSDVDAAVEFYRDTVGFTEVAGFSVPGEFCRDAGLTDGHPLSVRQLVLGEGDSATRLKLMAVSEAEPAPAKTDYIHSQLGFSYLTIYVSDLRASLARAKERGVTPVSKGPIPLNSAAPEGMNLAVIRDPDGNLVELLGPMKAD